MTKFHTSRLGRPGRVRYGTNQRGFTFIEIMMVVLIIGMLAAIVMPNVVSKGDRARIAAAKTQMKIIESEIISFQTLLGDYPTTDQGLDALVHRPADVPEDKWEKGLMQGVPKDPWGEDYIYRCPGEDGRDYDIFSKGKDKKEGTEDDVTLLTKETPK